MEELTFEQLQSRQSGKLAPRATASPDDEELTFEQLQAKAAATASDPSYANTDLKYAAERYLPKAAANAVEGWYNRSASRSAGGWLMEKLVSLTPEGKKAVDELDRPKAEKNDESFMETVASTLGYMAANPGHTLSEMGKDLAANPELLGIGSFGTVRGAARLADMAKLGRAGRVAATIGGSAAEGAVLMGLWDTALQLKNDEMDWKRTGVAAATGALMAPVMHGAVTGLKKLYHLWKNGKPVEAPPTPEEPIPPHPGDIDFDRPLTAAEADARTKKGTVKRNGQPYKSMREVPPGELASVIKGLDSEAESLSKQIKEAEAKVTAERTKAAKALSERIKVAESGENGMPTPETQALQEQLRVLTEPDKNGTPPPEIQALHDKLRSVNEYRDGILNNDPASPLAREVVYGQEFGKFPEGDTFDRADVTPAESVDVSQFIAERDAKPLEDRVRADRQEQVANRFRTKEGDAEQAWQEHKAAQAKAAELEALRTEYADLEESLTSRPLPGQKRASYQQAGHIDPDLAIRLGLATTGAALGGYLAGDEKLAGMALGAVGGLAATRLPGLGRSLGKAISPEQAFGSAMRISAALGAGYYLGGKVDHPIEGAVLASGLLIGRRFLKPAIAREGDALVNARNGNLAVWEWIRHNTKRDITEAVPDEARRTAIYEALQVGARGRLAPNEQKVFDVVTDLNAVTGRDAVDAGVLKSLRQNYVTSVVEREVVGTPNTKAELVRKIMGMAFREDTGPSTRFAKARKYDTLQELEAALHGTGLKVKTTDVAEVLDIYLKSMRKAVEDRVLINAVKQTQASDGTPYIAKRDKYGRFPEGYKQIDHPQLGNKAVHPELYDSLKIVFESSQPDIVTAGLLGASMAIKRAQVFGSLFHAKSLGEVYVLAMGSDMLPRPGDLTRPKRIIDEALNKFRTQGLGGEIEGLIKAGIKFGIPDDISTTIISDLGALADSATGVKLGSKMAEKIDYVNKHLDKATWDYMHTGVKASVALKEVENLIRNNAELHALDPKKYRLKSKEEIYQEVAGTVNDFAGGLDWFRIATQAKTELGRSIAMHFASPQGRRLAQIITFAPDWLMSSMRAGFKSFGESDAGFRGLIKPNNAIDLYRRYALRSAAIWVTILNGMQYALTGTPVWDNKDPTRLQFPDGTSLQAAKHSMEVPHAVADPVGFALNKLGYFPSLAADTAKYYAGGGHMKQSQDSPAVYAAKKAAPFTASPLLDHNLSAGERVGRSVSGALGMPLYGYNQEQRLAARRSRLEKLQSRKQNQ